MIHQYYSYYADDVPSNHLILFCADIIHVLPTYAIVELSYRPAYVYCYSCANKGIYLLKIFFLPSMVVHGRELYATFGPDQRSNWFAVEIGETTLTSNNIFNKTLSLKERDDYDLKFFNLLDSILFSCFCQVIFT
jgi:hypothetical protein